MEDDSETVVSGSVSSPVSVDVASPTLPIATDVNTDVTDTPAAVSSSSAAAHEQQQHL